MAGLIRNHKKVCITILILCVLIGAYIFSGRLFFLMGGFLIYDDPPKKSDVAIVLEDGLEYYPRLIEAASIYKDGLADKIIINGNRKTDTIRDLEKMGFDPCCPWYENSMRILEMLGVPRGNISAISAEDVYDTVGEAEAVGNEIVRQGYKSIILITSKFHTRRAAHIWKEMYDGKLDVASASAKADPFDPEAWYKSGRQVRWVMAEYGAWIFYYWQKLTDI
jgi:uncharacterized SAM-binding protein YcdF (DUF218 family)